MKKVSLFLATAVLTMALASCGYQTTAKLTNEIDSVNYAIGVAQGSRLKQQIQQQVTFDKEDTTKLESFYKAFLNGFNANFKEISEGTKQQLNGTSVGMELTTMIKKGDRRMGIQDGFFFGDSTLTVKKELVQKFVLEALNGKEEVGGFSVKTAEMFYSKIFNKINDSIPSPVTIEEVDSLNAAFAIMATNHYAGNLNDSTRGNFIKGVKNGFKITKYSEMYKVFGSNYAMRMYEGLKGGLMRDSTLTLQTKIFVAGLNAGVLADTTIMTPEVANEYLSNIYEAKQKVEMEKQKAEMEKLYGKNKVEGAEFLAENAKREGVTVTESGLQYEVIKQGKGAKPAATDTVTVHYHGTFIDSTVFDSSVKRGETVSFPLNGVIKGWTEGVQLMSVCSKYKFYIPYDLAYGDGGGRMEPWKTLIFEVELFEIKKFIPKAQIVNTDLTK